MQVAERWILARLRHVTYFSLAELNRHIGWLLQDLNNRPMRVYKKSRRELFEELDRPALRPLPETPYEYAEWKKARVNLDYHVELVGHYYSVPYRLVHQSVELRYAQTLAPSGNVDSWVMIRSPIEPLNCGRLLVRLGEFGKLL